MGRFLRCGPLRKKGNVHFLQFKLGVCKIDICLCSVCVLFVISLYRNNDKIEHNSSAVGRIYGREKAP